MLLDFLAFLVFLVSSLLWWGWGIAASWRSRRSTSALARLFRRFCSL